MTESISAVAIATDLDIHKSPEFEFETVSHSNPVVNSHLKAKSEAKSEAESEAESKSMNIVDMFRALEEKEKIITHILSDDSQTDTSQMQIDHRAVCRLLNVNIDDFFNNIYVPFTYFKNGNWDILAVLYKNTDALFFNESYMAAEDKERFNVIFEKYVEMMNKIFSPTSPLVSYLKKWTNMGRGKWTAIKVNSHLKSLLNDEKYNVLSPVYIIECFAKLNRSDNETGKKNMEYIKKAHKMELNENMKKVKLEIKKFRQTYHEIVTSYVYEHPLDYTFGSSYIIGFVNTIILAIMDLAEALIPLNVYAIHSIVMDIISLYTSLDSVNQYNPTDYNGRDLYIV
jgi:hypothetical protein